MVKIMELKYNTNALVVIIIICCFCHNYASQSRFAKFLRPARSQFILPRNISLTENLLHNNVPIVTLNRTKRDSDPHAVPDDSTNTLSDGDHGSTDDIQVRNDPHHDPNPNLPDTGHSDHASGHGESGHGDAGHEHDDPVGHSEHSGIHAPEILYIFLTLIIGAIAKYTLKVYRHTFAIPYTVFLLLLGCVYGAIAKQNTALSAFTQIAQADPNVILLTFLPGLIYEAAFSMQTYLFKKLLIHVLLIGSVGLAINIVAVAYLSQQVFQSSYQDWDINVGLLFSAIVSATDPIAAISLLHDAGTSKTLMVVLEGTSLLSDTSAVVLFNLFSKTIKPDSSVSIGSEITTFLLNVIGGPAWGLGIGFLLTQLLSRMSSVWEAELILILSVPYLTFWSADAGFGISGALATVVLGLWMSSHRTSISPDVEQLVNRIWELVSLISNTLIFSLVGVIIVQTALSNVVRSDWILLVVINIFILLVRAVALLLLKPILSRIGIGNRVFTWSHVFVLIWGGFKGAVTLALGMLGAQNDALSDSPQIRAKLIFHSAGVVAFTLFFNASTMRFFLKRLGLLDMPMSKMIMMHMALKQILLTRHQKLDALKTDRYLADADWQRVDELTKVEASRYGIEDEGETSLWTIHYVTREVSCPNCQAEVQLEPLSNELEEMESIARLRLVNAKKTSYWRQYEEGTLSQNGIKHLDDLSDTALNSDKGVISADDIRHCLQHDNLSSFKNQISNFQHWVDKKRSTIAIIHVQNFRRYFLRIATSNVFMYFIYVVIVFNIADVIADLTLGDTKTSEQNQIFLYTTLVFTIIYTFECVAKVSAFYWKGYWGRGWLCWNRFDFFMLLLCYLDLGLAIAIEVGQSNDSSLGMLKSGALSASILRSLRILRLLRVGRAIRLMKPIVPPMLHFLDGRINAHLFVAYDIAKAFIVAQEECSSMVPNVIGYKPLAVKFKTQADTDCRVILKEIGLLNDKRPDVAAAVKTRQAIRSILNHLHRSVEHMSSQGILDEDEVEHLKATIEDRLKRLHHFPHSIGVVRPLDRLWNVPWINGSQEVFDVMKLLFEERHYETATQFMTAGDEADGIYVVITGVVSLSYPRQYFDSPQYGEIYNSDNLRVTFDDDTNEEEVRMDYILSGGLMSEQSLALDFPRRSHAFSDTAVGLLYLDAETMFRAMSSLPAMEARFWRRIASSVVMNVLIQLGSMTDTNMETEKTRLTRGAVRLVRPGVKIYGLDEFDEVFIITGTLDAVTGDHIESLIGPRRLPPTHREVEVRQGRPAVKGKDGQIIYPEYAILFLMAPGNKDLSMINIHDSQTNLMDRRLTNPVALRELVRTALTNKTGERPSDSAMPSFLQESAKHQSDSVDVQIVQPRQKRGSDVGTLLAHGKTRQRAGSKDVFNILNYQRASMSLNEHSSGFVPAPLHTSHSPSVPTDVPQNDPNRKPSEQISLLSRRHSHDRGRLMHPDKEASKHDWFQV